MTIMHKGRQHVLDRAPKTNTNFQPKVKSICISYAKYWCLKKITKDKKYFIIKQKIFHYKTKITICLVVKYFVL